jgi:hypothetical protein
MLWLQEEKYARQKMYYILMELDRMKVNADPDSYKYCTDYISQVKSS